LVLIVYISRKLPLLLGLFGKFIYSTMIVVNSLQPTWPVEYVIYTATIPSAFTGAGKKIHQAPFLVTSRLPLRCGDIRQRLCLHLRRLKCKRSHDENHDT
jgi:hypothetical protein